MKNFVKNGFVGRLKNYFEKIHNGECTVLFMEQGNIAILVTIQETKMQ